MKTKLFALVLLLTTFNFSITAQEVIADELTNPTANLVIGDFMFFTQKNNDNKGSVSKIDLTDNTHTVIEVVGGLNEPVDIVNRGNELYVIERQGGLYKVDISQATPTAEFILDPTGKNNGNRSITLSIKDNFVYIALYDEHKIVKVNIDDNYPTDYVDVIPDTFFPSVGPIVNTFLYYTENNAVLKIDVTKDNPTPEVVIKDIAGASSFDLVGDDLYFVEYRRNTKKTAISKIDTNAATPLFSTLVLELDDISKVAAGFVIKDQDIYVSVHITEQGEIRKYTVPTLSQEQFNLDINKATIFPNPSSSQVTIQLDNNASIDRIEVFNLVGKSVLKQSFNNEVSATINIESLSRGIYFIQSNANGVLSTNKLIVE